MNANDRQVGGDHYKTGGAQHWDMFGPEYLIGCATKYVARWRKKNGVQDLEKALHYSEKLLEIMVRDTPLYRPPMLPVEPSMVDTWAPNQGVTWVETTIIKRLMFFDKAGDIREAIAGIQHLIATSQPTSQSTATPVPEGATVHVVDDLNPHMAERRVPRYMDTDKSPRPDADESRHASLYPWQMSRDRFMRLDQERRSLLDLFYTQRGDQMVLDACVDSRTIPRELKMCYNPMLGLSPPVWVISIQRLPAELREFYPRLQHELNSKELSETPDWQKYMYGRIEIEGKWRLKDQFQAWGPEL